MTPQLTGMTLWVCRTMTAISRKSQRHLAGTATAGYLWDQRSGTDHFARTAVVCERVPPSLPCGRSCFACGRRSWIRRGPTRRRQPRCSPAAGPSAPSKPSSVGGPLVRHFAAVLLRCADSVQLPCLSEKCGCWEQHRGSSGACALLLAFGSWAFIGLFICLATFACVLLMHVMWHVCSCVRMHH